MAQQTLIKPGERREESVPPMVEEHGRPHLAAESDRREAPGRYHGGNTTERLEQRTSPLGDLLDRRQRLRVKERVRFRRLGMPASLKVEQRDLTGGRTKIDRQKLTPAHALRSLASLPHTRR